MLQTIRPEFHRCAAWQAIAAAGNTSDTDTAADTGILSLEMRDNPFASLMRRIDRLLDTGQREDMLEAFELTRAAILDGVFEGKQELELNEKLSSIIELVHAARPVPVSGAFIPCFPRPALD